VPPPETSTPQIRGSADRLCATSGAGLSQMP
jgi:hypothetical protein